MGRTLGVYRADVQADAGHPPEDVVTPDEIDRRINDSYFEILRLFRHNRMKRDTTVTTADDTKEYALPSDYWWMRVVKDETNLVRLDKRRLEWIEHNEDGTTGWPDYWTIEDQNIRLYPTPGGTYTIRLWYMARPAQLVNETDVDILEDEWSEIIKLGALQRVFFMLGEYERHVHTLNLQRRLLNTIIEPTDVDAQTGNEIAGLVTEERDLTR